MATTGFAQTAIFEHCTVEFDGAYRLIFNTGQEFRDCVFKGRLNDSAFCVETSPEGHNKGRLIGCNFRSLEFNMLELRGTTHFDVQRFAGWPVVGLKENSEAAAKYDLDQFPREIRKYYRVAGSDSVLLFRLSEFLEDPEEMWAVAYDAPMLDFIGKEKKEAPNKQQSSLLKAKNRRLNRIHDKYSKLLRYLVGQRYYIKGFRRAGEDLFLEICDRGDRPREYEICLHNCVIAEFRGGPHDGILPTLEKPFHIKGYEIQHEADAVEVKGARKNMGRLFLSFEEATGYL